MSKRTHKCRREHTNVEENTQMSTQMSKRTHKCRREHTNVEENTQMSKRTHKCRREHTNVEENTQMSKRTHKCRREHTFASTHQPNSPKDAPPTQVENNDRVEGKGVEIVEYAGAKNRKLLVEPKT